MNRGNDRRNVFHEAADYESFIRLLIAGQQHCPVDVFGSCPMPNHFHILLRPQTEGALSAYFQWVTSCHARNLRRNEGTVGDGHVFQRRFWSAPVDGPLGFLTVLRYIEANPVRAGLVKAAQEWPWGSHALRKRGNLGLLSPLPVDLPEDWTAIVNLVQPDETITKIRKALLPRRGRPPLRTG